MADASQPRTRRDQLRLQQQQDARRQRTRMRVIYAVAAVVLLAIIATVTIVVVQQRRSGGLTPDQRAAQISPPNLNAAGTGIVQNPRTTGDVPTVTVYLDFQCPYCKAFNETYAPVLNQLAGAGEIKLEVTVLTVIGQALGNEDASERAGRAAFCADVVGVFPTYQDAVFAGQPEREGEGFTDEQLRVTFAQQAGLQDADLARFQQCYDQKATSVALASEQTKAMPGFDHSTPQVSINGTNPMIERDGKQVPWWTGLEPTTDAWQKAIAEHS